jgi:DNA replicative helicase MCM subunit Mcm2 (Cdc46/Mcm family)
MSPSIIIYKKQNYVKRYCNQQQNYKDKKQLTETDLEELVRIARFEAKIQTRDLVNRKLS